MYRSQSSFPERRNRLNSTNHSTRVCCRSSFAKRERDGCRSLTNWSGHYPYRRSSHVRMPEPYTARRAALLTLLLGVGFPGLLYGYVDPGPGLLLIQLIASALIGAAYSARVRIRSIWRSIGQRFRRMYLAQTRSEDEPT